MGELAHHVKVNVRVNVCLNLSPYNCVPLPQVARCQFEHNPSTPYGENLWASTALDPNASPVQWVTQWYAEVQYYNFTANLGTPSNFEQVGHFTQVR